MTQADSDKNNHWLGTRIKFGLPSNGGSFSVELNFRQERRCLLLTVAVDLPDLLCYCESQVN